LPSSKVGIGSQRFAILLIGFAILPLVSGVASYLGARDLLLIIFLLLGCAVFVVIPRFSGVSRDTLLLSVVLCMSLSLLLSATLISDNLHGYDIHEEFWVFLQVVRSGTWNIETHVLYNSALSVTVLPSVLSIVSGLNGISIFMLVFVGLFSMTPAILYKAYRRILAPEAAFLSVFLFMSYPSFYVEMVQLGRQEIAELLLALLLLFLLSSNLTRKLPGLLAALLLMVGFVTAHYSLAYIFLTVFVLSFAMSRISRRRLPMVSASMVLLFVVVVLCWYWLAAGGIALSSLARFVSIVGGGLIRDFYSPASRPATILEAVGAMGATPGLLHDVNRVTQYVVVLSLVFGFVTFILKRQKSAAERSILAPMMLGFSLLGFSVVLPFFAGGLNLSRVFHIALLFLSPCFVYGTSQIESLLRKGYSILHRDIPHIPALHCRRWTLAAIILLSYFLFVSGWAWAISGDRPTSLILDRGRMLSSPDLSLQLSYYDEYTVAQDIAGAEWMRSHIPSSGSVCGDSTSDNHVLNSYGEFPRDEPILPHCDLSNSYAFLSTVNTLDGVGTYFETRWSISDISTGIMANNRIYSTGGATIYT
jgi:uncharacterized membrane protein